ncbi:MAG: hypothetical protein ABIQ09_01220 [Jatrophihabitantaceae bacterium]
MADDSISLGMGAAWGYAGSDLSSPARIAAAGALPDTLAPLNDGTPRVTELRVHGVSGSDGPTMLEHPNVVQVAGDSITMFYRRWNPAGGGGHVVPWKLEAYSWGGLTQAPLAAAAWILMAPFMFFNLGQFMLPPTKGRHAEPSGGRAQRVSRDPWHAVAAALLRLLAVTATAQFAVGVTSILVNTLAYQGRQAHVPAWMRPFTEWSANVRVGVAAVAAGAVVAALWWVSVATERRYEARVSWADLELNKDCPLTQPAFWSGQELVRRQRSLHAAAALAVVAIVVARPVTPVNGLRAVVLTLAGVVLAAVVVSLCLRLADRHEVVLGRTPQPGGLPATWWRVPAATWWCRFVLLGAVVVLGMSVFIGGWQEPPAARTVPGLTALCAGLLITPGVLLVALGVVVWVCAAKARPLGEADPDRDPFLHGHLTTVITTLGVCLSGLLSALPVLLVSRLLGVPLPSGGPPESVPDHALEVPWPLYAFAAGALGLLAAGVLAVAWLIYCRHRDWKDLTKTDGQRPSKIGAYYGTEFGDPDSPHFTRSRQRIAQAWAEARLTDRVAGVGLALTVGMLLASALGAMLLAFASGRSVLGWRPDVPDSVVHVLASIESWVGLLLAGFLVTQLRSAYKDPSQRKRIGALWDVGTFWPRAVHPFAPPCYAERAVPELVDRIRVLTSPIERNESDPAWWALQAHRRDADRTKNLDVPRDPLLLTGYSQGAVIMPAVVAQLPVETIDRVALLTLACPVRRLYGRAFPAYFGPTELAVLARRLVTPATGSAEEEPETAEPAGRTAKTPTSWPEPAVLRWRNLVRETDYIGSWVREPVEPGLSSDNLHAALDHTSWDPPAIGADAYPSPAPTHRHSDFWQDRRTAELSRYLIGMPLPPTTGPSISP